MVLDLIQICVQIRRANHKAIDTSAVETGSGLRSAFLCGDNPAPSAAGTQLSLRREGFLGLPDVAAAPA